jgi:hypothetical protein
MKLDVFSCDWCGAHAPGFGSVGDGWAVWGPASIPSDKVAWSHLSEQCSAARTTAIEAARQERHKARPQRTK